MNTPKLKGIHVLISWLIFISATTFWQIVFSDILEMTGLSKVQGTKIQYALVQSAFNLISLIVSYFIYKFVVARFVLPKISFQNDSASSKPMA